MSDDALRYAYLRKRLRKGNTAKLLTTESLAEMLAAVKAATSSIKAEFYIWRGDQTGWQFADAMIERAEAGVDIRISYDTAGCIDVDPLVFDTMKRSGIGVLQYRPLAPWRPRWGIWRRNHRKVMIVDDRVGFVGGVNIADDYAPVPRGGEGWRDAVVRLTGPTVHTLNRLFERTWAREMHVPRRKIPPVQIEEQATVQAMILHNNEFGQRLRFRRAYVKAVKAATSRIWLANPYFLPGRAVRTALFKAVKRGVDVRVMVPSDSDVKIVGWAMEHLIPRLLSRGIRVFEWTGAMIHSKTACIDTVWATVGSYNLDHRSLRANLEANVVIVDQPFGEELDGQYSDDLLHCRELTLADMRAVSLPRRLRAWLFYQLRALL